MEFSTRIVPYNNLTILRQFYRSSTNIIVHFAPINVTFRFGGRDFTVSGWVSIREVFISGVETPMMQVQIGEPNLDFQPLFIEETGENSGIEAQDDGPNNEPNDDPV